jgi:hypothetical protein
MSLAGSYNGLAFGPGTKVHVAGVSGLDDLPGIRDGDAPRAGDHGSWAGIDYLDARYVDLTLNIVGDDFNDYAAQVAAVEAAFVPQVVDLPLLVYGSARQINARPRRFALPYEADRLARTGTAIVQLCAVDPRIYDANLQTLSTGLPTVSGGMTFNAAFNLGFGSAGTGGTIQAVNAGTYATRPVLVITGPCDTPIVQNVTQGKSLKFNLVLSAGDTLTVDTDAKSILLLVSGSSIPASRRATLDASSRWFDLSPGTSTITYMANAYQAASTLAVSFRSAWLGRGGVV